MWLGHTALRRIGELPSEGSLLIQSVAIEELSLCQNNSDLSYQSLCELDGKKWLV